MIKIGTVLVKPINTEKTVGMTDTYSFLVHPKSTKPLIKEAIKTFYGVEVAKVNIVKNPKKVRLVGRGKEITKRPEIKKAYITLKGKAKLDFNAYK